MYSHTQQFSLAPAWHGASLPFYIRFHAASSFISQHVCIDKSHHASRSYYVSVITNFLQAYSINEDTIQYLLSIILSLSGCVLISLLIATLSRAVATGLFTHMYSPVSSSHLSL